MGSENSLRKMKRRNRKEKGAEIGVSDLAGNEGSFCGANLEENEPKRKRNEKKKLNLNSESNALKKEVQKKKKLKNKMQDTTGKEVEDSPTHKTNVYSEPAAKELKKSKKKKRKSIARSKSCDESSEKYDAVEFQDKLKKHRETNMGDERTTNSHLEVSPEKRAEDAEDEVYLMSSGDEDNAKGLKKWITEYYQSRPGLNVLQQKIDEFIIAHDAQEEKATIEREAQAAEGGWTVVQHHKGRKKTTEAESGVAVGSVAPMAVLDKMAKKKKKEALVDFYRFQKREAQRNEIMMLQSKFEQDKKRIQQLRAARKFRPY